MIAPQQSPLPFDIFQLEAGGRLLWLEAAANLENAQLRVRELAKSEPTEFVIVNLETGDKLIMNRNVRNRSRSTVGALHSSTRCAPPACAAIAVAIKAGATAERKFFANTPHATAPTAPPKRAVHAAAIALR